MLKPITEQDDFKAGCLLILEKAWRVSYVNEHGFRRTELFTKDGNSAAKRKTLLEKHYIGARVDRTLVARMCGSKTGYYDIHAERAEVEDEGDIKRRIIASAMAKLTTEERQALGLDEL